MITELLRTILPTLLILSIIFVIAKVITGVKIDIVFKALIAGIITVLPAILFMKLLGIVITITVPITTTLLFFQILSSLNEEFFKYMSIKLFCNKKYRTLLSIFVGGGFALCEIVYLTIGNLGSALTRTYTTLPLHIITAILLSKSIIHKRYFLLALLLHISYNFFIRSF